MHPQKRVLVALLLLGGPAVLGSYAWGFAFWPDALGAMWGGVPEALRPAYTAWMFVAAAGFFLYTHLLVLRTDPAGARVLGGGYPRVTLCYALVLVGSALWMPLTRLLLDHPGAGLWWAVRGVLYAVALGSLGLVAAVATLRPAPPPGQRALALGGAIGFSVQTVLLDALVWPALFPAPAAA